MWLVLALVYLETGEIQMANMSYCRWNNIYLSLEDCVSNMQFWLEDNPGKTYSDYVNQLPSQEEKVMFGRLMKKAEEFLDLINPPDR